MRTWVDLSGLSRLNQRREMWSAWAEFEVSLARKRGFVDNDVLSDLEFHAHLEVVWDEMAALQTGLSLLREEQDRS